MARLLTDMRWPLKVLARFSAFTSTGGKLSPATGLLRTPPCTHIDTYTHTHSGPGTPERLEVYRSNTFSFEARSDRPVAFISYLSTDLFSEAAVVKEVDHAAAMSLNEHVAGHTSAHKVNKMSSRCVVREAMHSGSEVVVKQEWHNHTPIQISSVGEIR
ncbi:MAG: hypothetical protein FRX49_01762 [Trebouxia sp. A1-2]|nr:MAG: hypothetical protein FRX49_01762 [Trebouxia sp. A1-2]